MQWVPYCTVRFSHVIHICLQISCSFAMLTIKAAIFTWFRKGLCIHKLAQTCRSFPFFVFLSHRTKNGWRKSRAPQNKWCVAHGTTGTVAPKQSGGRGGTGVCTDLLYLGNSIETAHPLADEFIHCRLPRTCSISGSTPGEKEFSLTQAVDPRT